MKEKDEKLENEKELIFIKDFQLTGAEAGMVITSNIFVKKDGDNFLIYKEDGNLIGVVNEEGEMTFSDEYMESLKEKLGDYYGSLKLGKTIAIDKDKIEEASMEKEDNPEENKDEVDEILKGENTEELIEELEENTNRDITACTKIRDNTLLKEFPSVTTGEFNDVIITYSKETDTFQVEGVYRDENGKIQSKPLSELRTSKPIREEVTEIVNGEKIKETRTKAVIKFKENMNENTSIAVDLKNGGRINVKQLEEKTDSDGNISYIARDVRTSNQRPSEKELEEAIKKKPNDRLDEVISDATDTIVLSNGEKVTYEEMAQSPRFKLSVEEFRELYEKTDGSPEERLSEVEDIVNEQTRGKN